MEMPSNMYTTYTTIYEEEPHGSGVYVAAPLPMPVEEERVAELEAAVEDLRDHLSEMERQIADTKEYAGEALLRAQKAEMMSTYLLPAVYEDEPPEEYFRRTRKECAMAEKTIIWKGKSGKEYKYWIYPLGTSFDAVAANYIYSRETSPSNWSCIYVGETENLKERPLEGHHKETCIRGMGATHIHAHTNSAGQAARRAEEADIIENYSPDCND